MRKEINVDVIQCFHGAQILKADGNRCWVRSIDEIFLLKNAKMLNRCQRAKLSP
jgi:hypothetical protein